ncbi:MAG: hypothetical protein ACRDRQ_03045 [Pseudonocardiaceae bacterium]
MNAAATVFWVAAAAAGGAAVAAAGLEFWRGELPQQIALLGYALALMAAAVGLVLDAVNVTTSARDAWRTLAGDVDTWNRLLRPHWAIRGCGFMPGLTVPGPGTGRDPNGTR